MRATWLLICSVFSALLASLCCLGAVSYLLFGVALGSLNALDIPTWSRVLFSALAILFLLLGIMARAKKGCPLNASKTIGYIVLSIFVICIIFLPQLAGYFYE